MKDYSVPFYPNTSDNEHCFQASIKMVHEYFFPDKVHTFEQLDEITQKEEGMGTWPFLGLLWLAEQGLEVVDIEPFDYDRFITDPGNYLLEVFGTEMGEWQITHSNLPLEQERAQRFLQKITVQQRKPSIADMQAFLEKGFLVIVNVNSHVLYDMPGYCGHFVVVKGYTKDSLTLHNPGLPAQERVLISNDKFLKSWAYPDDAALNLVAVGKKAPR